MREQVTQEERHAATSPMVTAAGDRPGRIRRGRRARPPLPRRYPAPASAFPRPSTACVTTTMSTTAPAGVRTGTPVGPNSAPASAAAIAATTDTPRVSRSASRECSMRMPNTARHTAPTTMTMVTVSNTGESARPMSGPSAITPARRRTLPDRLGDFGVPPFQSARLLAGPDPQRQHAQHAEREDDQPPVFGRDGANQGSRRHRAIVWACLIGTAQRPRHELG